MTLCGLIAGLVPVLSADDRQVLNVLRDASRSHAGSRDKVRLRRFLLTAEVGLTMILLTSAGLLLKSYQQLRSVKLGCATHNVLTMEVGLPEARYATPALRLAFFEQLLDRVRALPGVEAAGLEQPCREPDASVMTLSPLRKFRRRRLGSFSTPARAASIRASSRRCRFR